MKKLLCILLAAMLTMSSAAFAETAGQQQLQPEDMVEEHLYQMVPVLDSMMRTMGIEGEFAYDANSPHIFWTQLSQLGANWGHLNPLVTQESGKLVIPTSVMQEYAAASFSGMESFPAIPQEITSIRFDAATNTYRVTMSDKARTHIIIERYAYVADGTLLVGVGLYDSQSLERLGGQLVQMADANQDNAAANQPFSYEVKASWAESPEDFAGLTVTNSRIQYIEETVVPSQNPVPTATPAPASTGYTKLSVGSRGEDVRALQKRLKELGYPVGSIDGVFGSNTKLGVRYFQDAMGTNQDGVATSTLQQKLYATSAPEHVTYVELQKGASGVRVEKLQNRLRELGYLAQPVDGEFGSRTKDAVALFQKAAKLKTDGIAGVKTLKALYDKKAPECTEYILLKRGDTGPRVKDMQERLIQLGFLVKKANQKYDNDTIKAVEAFIKVLGEKGDGKTANQTLLAKLFQYVTPTPTPTATPTPTTEPTATPTTEPTATPTTEPTPTPTPTPIKAITDDELNAFVTALNTILEPEPDYNAVDAVKWLQEKLAIEQNGIYDTATKDAVKAYQITQSLPDTGIADADTIHKLI